MHLKILVECRHVRIFCVWKHPVEEFIHFHRDLLSAGASIFTNPSRRFESQKLSKWFYSRKRDSLLLSDSIFTPRYTFLNHELQKLIDLLFYWGGYQLFFHLKLGPRHYQAVHNQRCSFHSLASARSSRLSGPKYFFVFFHFSLVEAEYAATGPNLSLP